MVLLLASWGTVAGDPLCLSDLTCEMGIIMITPRDKKDEIE